MPLKRLEISMVLEDLRRWQENVCALMRAFQPVFTVVVQDVENASKPGNSSRVDAFSINLNKKAVFFFKKRNTVGRCAF